MSRIHDVGGMEGFGAVDPYDDGEAFHADWEARVYALQAALLRRGVYRLDEFRDAIERLEPSVYLQTSYYARWLAAIEDLLDRKGVLERGWAGHG
ncbi:nitrile hydratase [Pseudonocardia eucalypti]|uniref:SH3-like domain-containing protein n=1 Tax=Pseudonocardia eucalypti TaxID=648755 RepID=UPI001613DD0A|nr:nitrile hydratase [Pseudonocardia eucalypti]